MARTARHSIFKELVNSEDERLKSVAEFFADLALKTEIYSAEYIINNISAKLFANSNNYELYSNLNTLRDILLTKSKRGSKKLHLVDFCALVDAYNNAEMQIINKSPYHESDTAVKLETVHSAKGLEFDHVFLIAVDNGNWSEAGGNNDRFTLPRNLEYVRHTGDSADEKLRVFFVAITRARANLYLTYSLSDFNGKKGDRLKYLSEHETEDGQLVSQILPEAFKNVIVSSATTIAPDVIAPDKWFDNFVPTDEVRRNQLKPLVEHYRISPTHLNTFIDLQYGDGPLSFLKYYIIGVPSETSFSMNYGRYVHEIMDEINKEKISNEEAIKRFMAKVDNADATDEEKDELKKRAEAELTRFLAERGNMIRDVNAESERGFFKETITLGDAVLTGMIDRVEIDEENKTITVADFKTGRPKSKWEASNFGYKLQLYFYKFLLENCKEYQNYKVTKGRIDYISPNDEDEIVSLDLKFKDEEAAEIKHLIQVVFRHIKALDLPDTEAAKASSNPTKAFYDQLIAED
jgi:DNA helicase-2/ATP-dependent DNA helicase PcrA